MPDFEKPKLETLGVKSPEEAQDNREALKLPNVRLLESERDKLLKTGGPEAVKREEERLAQARERLRELYDKREAA